MAEGAKKVVYAALIGNVLVTVTKTVAGVFSGSSAMLSEAIHSFVDTGNEVLLLYGMRRSQHRPDADHPLGYGRELYFWSFIVALLVFAVGAGASFYEGLTHLRAPHPIRYPAVNFAVLGLSLLFEGGSWIVAMREFRATKGDQGYFQAIRTSKDPPKFMVLLEDSAAILGILMALAGTWASVALDDPRFDGIASLGIGALLAGISVVLARESKGLLIGERADPAVYKEVTETAAAMPGIVAVNGLLTTHLAPNQVVAALSLEFDDALNVTQVERIVADLETSIREKRPEISALFVKPQTGNAYRRAHRRRMDGVPNDSP